MIHQLKHYTLFFKEYLANPKLVASVAPSGAALAKAMVEHSYAKQADTIVEIGTGTGVITEKVFLEKKSESTFFAIEINKTLAQTTRDRCPDVEVVCEDAKFLKRILLERGLHECDSVVSCIPWATLSLDAQEALLEAIYSSLANQGRFATLLFVPGLPLSTTKAFIRAVESKFGKVNLSPIIWRNLPPAVVLWAEKMP